MELSSGEKTGNEKAPAFQETREQIEKPVLDPS
ncbi:hypothetical protein PH5382_02048 [Phaeobacter sp. CECT 5382]|nr:hypothetical protein PH5382_02048 [Phaeobacter sp. CECT 5382]